MVKFLTKRGLTDETFVSGTVDVVSGCHLHRYLYPSVGLAADSLIPDREAIGNIAKTERREDCRIYVLPFVEACGKSSRLSVWKLMLCLGA